MKEPPPNDRKTALTRGVVGGGYVLVALGIGAGMGYRAAD